MAGLDLDDTEQPMDPKLAMAIESAFRTVSLTPVEFVAPPRAWCKRGRSGSSKKGPSGTRKGSIKMDLAKRDGARCAYCAREFVDLADATLDHVIPNRVVGHWEPWNLLLSCEACNGAKADRIPLVLLPILCALLRDLVPLSDAYRCQQRALKKQQQRELEERLAGRAERRAAHEALARRAAVRRQIQALSSVPVRLAIEAPKTLPALMPGGAR